jgi:hypothetical protein
MLIYVLRWRPSWISDRHKKQKFGKGPSNDHSWAVWFQLSKSKRFFSETTWTIETKLPMNDHWKVIYQMTVFYADRKSKMAATKLSTAVAAILNFTSEQKT